MMIVIQKILSKYNKLGAPAKASLWFMVCGFLQKGISFLTTPIFTRVMADVEYGSFTVYNSWYSFFQIVISLNLAAGVYTRGLVKCEDDQERFSSSLMGLSITCMCIAGLIYLLFHKQVNQWLGLSTIMMTGMFLEIWGTTAYQFWSNKERVNFRYKKLAVLTIIYVLLRPSMGVLFVLFAETQYQMEARIAATVIVQVLLFTPLFISILKKGKVIYHRKYWIYGLKFNIPLIPHYLSQIVLNQADRVMIDNICGAAEAAYYSVAYTLAMVLQILSNAISSTMNPWIYKALKKGDVAPVRKLSYNVLLLIAAANLLVVAIAPEIMFILAPSSYQAALWVIPPVTASVYFMFLYNLFATFEYYYEKTVYVMAASVAGAILNIILNGLLIPRFGFIAAGYTTLFCYIIYAFAHYYFMKKVCRFYMHGEEIYDAKKIVFIGAAFLLSIFVITLLYRNIVIRYSFVLGLAVLFWKKKKQVMSLFDKSRYAEN